jgi:hypothetical protein
LVIAARLLAFAAAAACPAGVAVVGAAAAAVGAAAGAGAAVVDVVGATAAAGAAAAELTAAIEETGADETGAAVGAVFCAAGVTLVWCPAQPVASVTTSVTPATSVRDDLRITSAPS